MGPNIDEDFFCPSSDQRWPGKNAMKPSKNHKESKTFGHIHTLDYGSSVV